MKVVLLHCVVLSLTGSLAKVKLINFRLPHHLQAYESSECKRFVKHTFLLEGMRNSKILIYIAIFLLYEVKWLPDTVWRGVILCPAGKVLVRVWWNLHPFGFHSYCLGDSGYSTAGARDEIRWSCCSLRCPSGDENGCINTTKVVDTC